MQLSKCRERLMGSDFELVVCGKDNAERQLHLQQGIAEIKRLELLLTEFSADSDTGRINAAAGIAPVPVAGETFRLLQRCLQLSHLTQGAFDISAGTLKKLYRFEKETQQRLPHPLRIREALQQTGYRHIHLDEQRQEVYLAKKGMRISFAAIGKGYAADRVKKCWQEAGVASGVVNASGDLTAWGQQADGSPWRIGIADPDDHTQIRRWLPVNGASVATSGNYEQYFEVEGIRYSHNIDPRTGMPARRLKSVTVISPKAELSDALATAVTIMGTEAGMDMIRQLPQVHALIIDESNRVFTSEKVQTYVA